MVAISRSPLALAVFALLCDVVLGLAPLEPPDGKMLFGAWYDRIQGDTPAAIEERVGKHLSLWQSDINITDTLQSPLHFFSHVESLNTDAVVYLTVYPIDGFDVVTDSAINELARLVGDLTKKGRKVFLRYASEMNGSWFKYGQQPRKFLASWRKVTDAVRSASIPDNLAVVWAPNAGDQYPWVTPTSIRRGDPDFDVLDTNHDGLLNMQDDPYGPYYPGDDYVDWVGFSIYHYGPQWPWVDNTIPIPGRVENFFFGNALNGDKFANMYDIFAIQRGKPFMISETGATYHMEVFQGEYAAPGVKRDPGPGRVAIKQTWWRQIFNETFAAEFPKLKAVGFFEFMKYEEDTLRDFTNLGAHPGTRSNYHEDDQVNAVLAAFKADLPHFEHMIIWANVTTKPTTAIESPSATREPYKPEETAYSGAAGNIGGFGAMCLAGLVGLAGFLGI